MFKGLKKKKESSIYNSDDYKYFVHPDYVGQDPSGHVTVIRTECRWCYDSVWQVITPHFVVAITRSDNETAERLLDDILALPSFTKKEILALDQKDQIYYD